MQRLLLATPIIIFFLLHFPGFSHFSHSPISHPCLAHNFMLNMSAVTCVWPQTISSQLLDLLLDPNMNPVLWTCTYSYTYSWNWTSTSSGRILVHKWLS